MRMILSSMLTVIICTSLTYAKDEVPATKLEAFNAKTGTVLIKGYSEVGTIDGKYSETISVAAKDFTNPSNPKAHSSGITINVKEAGRLQRESTAFVDLDEIDSLIAGIDYISKATKAVTYLDGFEAIYRTKGDLKITVFSDSNSNLSAAIEIDRGVPARAFIELNDMMRLRQLIIDAKSKLKT